MTSVLTMFLMLCFLMGQTLAEFSSNGTDAAQSAADRFRKEGYLELFVAETEWYNDIVLGPLLPKSVRLVIPHILQTWLRNYLAGLLVYFATGGLWCLYIYHWKAPFLFPDGNIPGWEPILMQIQVSMQAMPMYTALPTLSEYMVEKGWTRCYSQIEQVGWSMHLGHCILYLVIVEFGIYWMHRGLHDIKPLYKILHATHHIYNKQDTLSPFAGLAFHPLDGILQAAPHVVALFLVWPIMGAAYHTIHHTTYRHNYGHYTIFMDWICGTLRPPSGMGPTGEKGDDTKSK